MATLQEVKDVFSNFIDNMVNMYVAGEDGNEAADAAINDLKNKGISEEAIYESIEAIANLGIAIKHNDVAHGMMALGIIDESRDKVMQEITDILNTKLQEE